MIKQISMVLCLTLVACGTVQQLGDNEDATKIKYKIVILDAAVFPLKISEVAPKIWPEFSELVDELGPEIIVVGGSDGRKVINNTEYVVSQTEKYWPGKRIVGLTDAKSIVVMTPGKTGSNGVTLAKSNLKGVLAHEIGHALGLKHTDHGIMRPGHLKTREGKETRLLLEALAEAGKISFEVEEDSSEHVERLSNQKLSVLTQ